jgi:hypothetical protein
MVAVDLIHDDNEWGHPIGVPSDLFDPPVQAGDGACVRDRGRDNRDVRPGIVRTAVRAPDPRPYRVPYLGAHRGAAAWAAIDEKQAPTVDRPRCRIQAQAPAEPQKASRPLEGLQQSGRTRSWLPRVHRRSRKGLKSQSRRWPFMLCANSAAVRSHVCTCQNLGRFA